LNVVAHDPQVVLDTNELGPNGLDLGHDLAVVKKK
jgi:hypothetical protein